MLLLSASIIVSTSLVILLNTSPYVFLEKYDNGTLLIFLSKSERNFFDIFKATRAKMKEVKNVHIALII